MADPVLRARIRHVVSALLRVRHVVPALLLFRALTPPVGTIESMDHHRATYGGAVSDKRQLAKQRRAARNRAARAALAARSQNAGQATRMVADDRGAADAGRGGARTAPSLARAAARRRPGSTAILAALVYALVIAVLVLVFARVPIDDRGEPLPLSFRGVAIEARETLTGNPIGDESTGVVEAQGPLVVAAMALPVLICAFALWGNRRADRSRIITFAMLALAGAILLGSGIFFLPALIALAIASFQVRRLEAPARMGPRARPGPDGRTVVDAQSSEDPNSEANDAAADEAEAGEAGPQGPIQER